MTGNDFVHYDFTPANLLSDGTVITGVIDVNPPLLAGDRAFDLATMLFYCYDHDEVRGRYLRLARLVVGDFARISGRALLNKGLTISLLGSKP